MTHRKLFIILLIPFLFCCRSLNAQQIQDTSTKKEAVDIIKKAGKDSLKKFNPRVATFRSAVFPGWGQIYNKKYWKLGLIYPALGITAGVFFYNLNTYKELRQAYKYKSDPTHSLDSLIPEKFRSLSAESIRTYRNEFRQNIDYSVLVFIIFWGLNVIDATVDAHLKAFDVSDDISLKIKPGFSPLTNTTGVSFIFSLNYSHNRHTIALP